MTSASRGLGAIYGIPCTVSVKPHLYEETVGSRTGRPRQPACADHRLGRRHTEDGRGRSQPPREGAGGGSEPRRPLEEGAGQDCFSEGTTSEVDPRRGLPCRDGPRRSGSDATSSPASRGGLWSTSGRKSRECVGGGCPSTSAQTRPCWPAWPTRHRPCRGRIMTPETPYRSRWPGRLVVPLASRSTWQTGSGESRAGRRLGPGPRRRQERRARSRRSC